MKKQTVFVRIPGYSKLETTHIQHLGEVIKKCLDTQFPDKETVVLISDEDIHFLNEYEVNNMIQALEDLKH